MGAAGGGGARLQGGSEGVLGDLCGGGARGAGGDARQRRWSGGRGDPDGRRLRRGRGRAALGRLPDGAMSNPVGPAPQPGKPSTGRQADPLLKWGLGVPWLFAAAYSAVGFSIYFALRVVADRGLGLTPLIFLASGLLFGLTTLSYVEGGPLFRDRGGSSTLARHAFNELVAFIAGWAILIDYLIVIALAAISVPHYLEPISGDFADPGWEIGLAAAVIAAVCALNILNVTGRAPPRSLAVLARAALRPQ